MDKAVNCINNSIIPHSTSKPSKKRFADRCFLSCPANTCWTEIKTVERDKDNFRY